MRAAKWICGCLTILAALAFLPPAAQAGGQAAGTPKIQLSFPDSPNVICGVGEVSEIKTFPEEHRDYLQALFNDVYPEIVKIYGEPLTGSADGLRIKVFYAPGSNSSMYLSHKSGTEIKVIASLLGGPLGMGCAALADIPDHAMFLHQLPGENGFDHLFTHELIHVFHDRMDFISWYTRSWLEEGMTEAAAEIVADQMKAHYLRDVRGSGINGGPADNLKHYDMWTHPYNGPATSGQRTYTNSHALGALHYFYGGITLVPTGDDISFGLNRSVIPTQIRYGAATALWLILTKACSPDPSNPDFLLRLNRQLDVRGITSLRNNAQLFDEIGQIAGIATVDGQPVRQWLESQALLKGTIKDDGEGALFIDVQNPENFQENKDSSVEITVYALYPISLNDPGDILSNLNGAELPMRNCGVKIKIIDAAGKVWLERDLPETDGGTYTFNGAITDSAGQNILLPEGGYVIQATAGLCDRLSIGLGESVKPGGVSSATYAMRSGKGIGGGDNRLLGVALNQQGILGGPAGLRTVGAAAKASLSQPYYTELAVSDGAGSFIVDDHGQTRPFDVTLSQWIPDGSQNQRPMTVPYPYARVNWIAATPDYYVDVEPKEAVIDFLRSAVMAVKLVPNGIWGGSNSCPVRFALQDVPAGVKIDFNESLDTYYPGLQAPNPTYLNMKIQLTSEAKAGRYNVKVLSWGAEGSCSDKQRSADFQLLVLKPVHLTVNAVRVTSSGTTVDTTAPVTVTSNVLSGELPTPINILPRQYSDFTLEAKAEINVNGEWFRFANWEFNGDPNQRNASNPLTQAIQDDLTITARYVKKEVVSVTVEGRLNGATASTQIPVPVSYRWGTSGGPTFTRAATAGIPTGTGSGTQTTTFEIAPPRGVTVTLEASPYVKVAGRFYQFASWGGAVQQGSQPKATYNTTNGNITIAAYYQTTSAVFEGTLDAADGQQIAGWVWDRSQPNGPISVDVYDGSTKLATVSANLFRQDLLNFGVGNGYHAFSLPTPASLKDGKAHVIYARLAGTQIELGNSPKSLTVVLPPVISSQPVSLAVCQGQPAIFSVTATGVGLAYQWLKNGAPLTGANGSQLNISAAGAGDAANYSIVVSNAAGSVTSSPAKLAVNAPVAVTKQPVNAVACQGQPVTFSVSATGDGVRYQWRKNGGNIAGATGSSLTIPTVGTGDAGSYTVYVYNGCSSVTSANADLTIKDPITITGQPASLTKAPGQSATFSVAATGPGLRYQWRGKDGGNIPGATNSSYTIPSVTTSDAGSYYVVVYNGCGTVNSAAAMLTVSLANPANNARFEIQNVPTTMTAGQSYNVAIKMTNTGTSVWTKANGYKLLPQRPQGNSTWGVSGVDLPATLTQVSPNGVAVFNFTIIAPTTPGSYVFEWRMAQNGVGFGDFSPALPVTVSR